MARLKRLAAPKIWNLKRKTKLRYTFSPSPGPHPAGNCLTLGFVLRDVLGAASNAKEIRELLANRMVKVDNIIRKNANFPVGMMDVLTVGENSWIVLPDAHGFYLKPAKDEEKGIKLLQVKGKTYLKGKLQLNFHDGRNMLVDKDIYKTGDVVVFDIATRKSKEVLQFKRGALGLVTDGRLRGTLGKIEEIIFVRGVTPNKVVLKTGDRKLETLKDYIFIVGQDKPAISMEKTSEQVR